MPVVAYFGFVLSAIHQPVLTFVGTVHGRSLSQYTLSSVLRSAGLLSLNLRGRSFTVPANGCLATLLLRWQCVRSRTVLNRIPQIAWGKPFHQVNGNLRFPLTVTYHGCPESSTVPHRPRRILPPTLMVATRLCANVIGTPSKVHRLRTCKT